MAPEKSLKAFGTKATQADSKPSLWQSDVKHLIQIIDRFGILVQVTTKINRCRDIKDNFLLGLAVDSNTDYLVTGDNDLLDLEHINKTKIITIQGLRETLK